MGSTAEIAKIVRDRVHNFDIRYAIIGHLQRGGSPNSLDRLLASRLGYASVEGLIHGQKNVMAGIINDKVVFTPFQDAIAKDKPIDRELIRMAEILAM